MDLVRHDRAEVVPAYGFRSVGGYGIRGWRVFCPTCGHLSDLYENRLGVNGALHAHRAGRLTTPRRRTAA